MQSLKDIDSAKILLKDLKMWHDFPPFINWLTFQVEKYFQSTIDCRDGEVRLVEGRHYLEGRVEVCYDRVWGTVCSDNWEKADAIVVCRQFLSNTSGKQVFGALKP